MNVRDRARLRACLLSAAAVSVLAAAAPAMAQVAAPGEATMLPDVIVTANKREERLHDVPATVSVLTAEILEKHQINDARDFPQFAPTLNFQAADEARLFNFSIRGIGTEAFSVGVEPSVAVIVDGVVYTRPGAAFDGLTDLERVEVLSGPQGTLQGKNASAGAVVIVTKGPVRDHWERRFEGTIAEDNEYRGALTFSGPISDSVAIRAYGYYGQRDGKVINVATGDTVNNVESYGFRGKVEWRPSDTVTFLLAGDVARRKADCCGEPIRVASATGNVTAAFTKTPVGPDNRYVNFDTVQEGEQKNEGISLQGDFQLGEFSLTSLTAYRHYSDFAIRDRDGTNAPYTGVTAQQLFSATVPGITAADAMTRLEALMINDVSAMSRNGVIGESNSLEQNGTFSQEIRLTSPVGEKVDYLAGLYFYDGVVRRNLTIAGVRSNIAGNVTFTSPTTVVVNRPTAYVLADMVTRVHTTNAAVFGNLNYRPVDKLTLTAGFRYLGETLKWHHQKVTGPNGDHIGAPDPARPGANFGTPVFDVERKFDDTAAIGKLISKYEFTPDLLVFGSYARGYKGQAVDADIYLTQASYNASPAGAEKSRSWEAGFKGRFFDRHAELNVTYYDTLFTGYQTSSAGLDGSGAPVLRSAGKLYTSGVEGDVTFRPTRALTLSGNFLFADNAFGDLYVDAVTNVKGGRPLNAPDTKYGLSGSYEAVVSDWPVSFNANYTWTSKTLFSNLADANNPNSVWLRPSFGVANASVTVRDPRDRYRVTVFVKNLGDKHYVDGLRRISGSVGGAGAVAQSLPRDFDRYVGATFAAEF
jgi:iron complex outermembrane receptor protein